MTLKNNWANGDTFTPAAANDMANAVNNIAYRGAVDLRDFSAVSAAQWKTNTGASYTSGQYTLTNSTPFTSSDVGKIVIVNEASGSGANGGYLRWKANIVSVNSSGVATLDAAAPSTASGVRVQWGFDGTSAINAALSSLADESSTQPREAFLPGWYRATQIVVPGSVTLRGAGWGSYGGAGLGYAAGTLISQLPGAQKDLIVFSTLYSGFIGPVGLTNINLQGPECNVRGFTPSTGNGVALKLADGTILSAQDGCEFSQIHAFRFPESGFYFPNGGLPLTVDNCRAFYNGGYGFNYDNGTNVARTQAVHFSNCSADGNVLGGIRIYRTSSYGDVAITSFKSEADTSTLYGTQTGFGYVAGWAGVGDTQMSAIILEDCDTSPIVVNGVSHIYGGATKGPGPSILIKSATTKIPRLVFNGVATRLTGSESGSTADAFTLRDQINSVNIPITESNGVYPAASPRTASLTDANGATALVIGANASAVNYFQLGNQVAGSSPILYALGSDTNVSMFVRPKGTGIVYLGGDASQSSMSLAATSSATNVDLNLTTKGTGTVQANGSAVLISGGALGTPSSATLTNATGLPLAGVVDPDDLTTGESTISRRAVCASTVSSGNGNLRLTYFTAKKTETVTQIRTITGGTAAAGATLCRVGIYSVDGSGNLTLIASIANDTALWAAASTAYTRSLSASFSKVAKTRYAVGHLVVGTTTAPTFLGQGFLNNAEAGISPRISGFYGSQTDLPSSISAGSISDTSQQHYAVLLP